MPDGEPLTVANGKPEVGDGEIAVHLGEAAPGRGREGLL